MFNDKIKRVRIKFLESMAGLADPKPAELEKKYAKLADVMERTVETSSKPPRPIYTPSQIAAALAAQRATDDATIRSGFTKDWAFLKGQEAVVNEAIAEHWEAAGLVAILPAEKKP